MIDYCENQLIKNWHELMRAVENTIRVINEIQKVSSTSSTFYKDCCKSNIK